MKDKYNIMVVLLEYILTFHYEINVKVTACVLWQGHKLGFSCYDADTSYLHCMSDVVEAEEFGYLNRGITVHI